jgi:hypothetical protein
MSRFRRRLRRATGIADSIICNGAELSNRNCKNTPHPTVIRTTSELVLS